MTARTPGQRLFLVRLACGDGVRTPEPMVAFAERVERVTGKRYDQATISLLERDKQKWKLEDTETFARVDPLERGAAWIGYGSEPVAIDPDRDRELTAEEIERATRLAAREAASQKKPAKGRRRGA